jgi:hypothetical protein
MISKLHSYKITSMTDAVKPLFRARHRGDRRLIARKVGRVQGRIASYGFCRFQVDSVHFAASDLLE